MNKILLVFLFIFTTSGCSKNISPIKPVNKQVGFTILPFPSDNFMVGQIVELYTKPNKVIITYSPDTLKNKKIHIYKGWNISDSSENFIKRNLQKDISKILKSKYTFASEKNLEISFINTQTNSIYKHDIFNTLKNTLKNNVMIRDHILGFRHSKWRTKYDVVIQTLSAYISFKLTDSSGHIVAINPSTIEKINTKLPLNFFRSGEKIITDSRLVVGIYTDPDILDILIKQYETQVKK